MKNYIQEMGNWGAECRVQQRASSFITPEQRHAGKDDEILQCRKAVYQQAKLRNPNRWSGEIRNWDKVEEVYLNPENQKIEIEQKEQA